MVEHDEAVSVYHTLLFKMCQIKHTGLDLYTVKDPLFLIKKTRFYSYFDYLFQIKCPIIFFKCSIN